MRRKRHFSEKVVVWCVTLALVSFTFFGLAFWGDKFIVYVAGAALHLGCILALIYVCYLVSQLIVDGVKQLGISFSDWGGKDTQNRH